MNEDLRARIRAVHGKWASGGDHADEMALPRMVLAPSKGRPFRQKLLKGTRAYDRGKRVLAAGPDHNCPLDYYESRPSPLRKRDRQKGRGQQLPRNVAP